MAFGITASKAFRSEVLRLSHFATRTLRRSGWLDGLCLRIVISTKSSIRQSMIGRSHRQNRLMHDLDRNKTLHVFGTLQMAAEPAGNGMHDPMELDPFFGTLRVSISSILLLRFILIVIMGISSSTILHISPIIRVLLLWYDVKLAKQSSTTARTSAHHA